MNRRSFINGVAMTMGSSLFAGAISASGQVEKRPNILFIFADDHCPNALSAFGSEVDTPNIDRLIESGVNFENAYIQGSYSPAVCIASRAMLNTGKFLWNAEKFNYNRGVKEGRMWSQYIGGAGYDTYMAGKWHVKARANAIFDYTGNVRGGMPRQTPAGYGRPKNKEDYEQGWKPWEEKYGGFWAGGKHWSEVLGNEGVQFLEDSRSRDNPFFMYISFNAPHDPRQSPKEYVDKYPLDQVEVPKNFLPEYPYNREIGSPRGLRDERLAPFPRTEYSVKVNRQEYYAIISHMDTQIGRILKALKESGEMENTYIIFAADHGLAVGQHGLMGKQNMYDHSMKAPLVICGPGIPKGQNIEAPVYIQDIVPTSLELAEIDVPDEIEFRSLLPLIKGERDQSYDAIYGAYRSQQRMLRKGDYKLIYYTKIDKALLFNLRKDPHEIDNLADDPQYAARIKDMFESLTKWQEKTGDGLKLNPSFLSNRG